MEIFASIRRKNAVENLFSRCYTKGTKYDSIQLAGKIELMEETAAAADIGIGTGATTYDAAMNFVERVNNFALIAAKDCGIENFFVEQDVCEENPLICIEKVIII